MNLEDFSLFKLRSAIFLINFPLSFTLAIVSIWYRIMPDIPTVADNYTRDEIDQIMQTKAAIKTFCEKLTTYIDNLLEYLTQVKRDKPFKPNYQQIIRSDQFLQFKKTMTKTKGISLVPVRVDELFIQTYERMAESIDTTIGNTIQNLETKK